MAARTMAERSRAKLLRRKRREGKRLSPDEGSWLVRYEASTAGKGRPPGLDGSVQGATTIDDAEVISEEVTNPRPAPTGPPDDWQPIASDDDDDDDHDHPPEKAHPPAKVCTIVDCPACVGRDRTGPSICGTTGKEVWPPLGMNSARMLAGVVFLVFGWMVKVMNKLPEIPEPTELERDELARAIIDVVRRRAGPLAAWDDLLAGGWALGAYHRRAKHMKQLPKEGTKADA